jgi:hypothetical protein
MRLVIITALVSLLSACASTQVPSSSPQAVAFRPTPNVEAHGGRAARKPLRPNTVTVQDVRAGEAR